MELRAPLRLEGRWTAVRPLVPADAPALAAAGADPRVWAFLPYPPATTPAAMATLIARLREREARGTDLCFVIERRFDARPVGMTRFLEIDRDAASVEIGGTWLRPDLWRTPLNTETKRLLLGHAFETEGAHRVALKTDPRNERSRRAIERLGAQPEGIRREHLRLPDGRWRSSAYFSILAPEWPAVRARLDARLARPFPATVTGAGTGGPASR